MNETKVYGFPFPRRGSLKTIRVEELPYCDYCEGEHRKAGYRVAESSEMGKQNICNQCIVDKTNAGNPVKLEAILWNKSVTP